MEPVGLAVGVMSLAGLLTQVIECFDYIRVAHNSRDSYDFYMLRLRNSQLRLTRWEASVELNELSNNEVEQVESILRSIIAHFDKAETLSKEFAQAQPHIAAHQESRLDNHAESRSLANDHETAPLFNDTEHSVSMILEKMKKISLKRNPTISKRKKAKWAMYSEQQTKELVERLSSLTTDLIELFPDSKAKQEKMCELEVWELTANLRQLSEAVKGQDELLVKALDMMLKPAVRPCV